MKKLLFYILLAPTLFIAQNNQGSSINSYKYILHEKLEYSNGRIDRWGISSQITDSFREMGFEVVFFDNQDWPKDYNPCETLILDINHTNVSNGFNHVDIKLTNCEGRVIYSNSAKAMGLTLKADYRSASKKVMAKLKNMNYSFDKNLAIKGADLFYDLSEFGIDSKSEDSFRDYFDSNASSIEGIWENQDYRLAIIKKGYYFLAINLNETTHLFKWLPGDLKAKIEPTATNSIMTVNWTLSDKKTTQKVIAKNSMDALLEFDLSLNGESSKTIVYKVYPSSNNVSNNNKVSNSSANWLGNGSGIIISTSGHIVTNNHVIENASDIEVECFFNGESQKFNAEVLKQDLRNDLAILKIVDVNFDGTSKINYNFKVNTSDVGTKIYTFGYPKALNGMGKEIKVTEGIISAKSGVMGDITTYQITAPIQGGNSGGPLFDDNGNLIGINSSKFNSDQTENVNYSIKTSYVLNLIDVLPNNIDLPSSELLKNLKLTDQIKEISKYVVLIKVK